MEAVFANHLLMKVLQTSVLGVQDLFKCPILIKVSEIKILKVYQGEK